MYISYVAKAHLSTAVLRIFTADCLHHPIQMAGIETIWELHTLSVINSWFLLQLTNYFTGLEHVHSNDCTLAKSDSFALPEAGSFASR